MRIAIVNLFYPPSLAPSAHLAASLADHRAAQGDDVTVVCGRGGYLGGAEEGARSSASEGEPTVIRLWTPALGKATDARRLGDYVVFLVGAVARLLLLPRHDVVIALTTLRSCWPPRSRTASCTPAPGSSSGPTTRTPTRPRNTARSVAAGWPPGCSGRSHDG